ncbi:MAG: hypothetical protein JNK74_15485 [Candidatus Hydrogenedentes bacterium]|nr:hypothetical protein [Candidatus Hydrogenedentota bacterium]
MTLDVELSGAIRGLPLARRAPERCRIVFQRASEALWQVTAHDDQGTVYCDATSDGRWIEVDGKCWHPCYNEFFYDEGDADSEVEPSLKETWEARVETQGASLGAHHRNQSRMAGYRILDGPLCAHLGVQPYVRRGGGGGARANGLPTI